MNDAAAEAEAVKRRTLVEMGVHRKDEEGNLDWKEADGLQCNGAAHGVPLVAEAILKSPKLAMSDYQCILLFGYGW